MNSLEESGSETRIAPDADGLPLAQPTIWLADNGRDVSVRILLPVGDDEHDRVFSGYLRARAYARLLWMEIGFPVVDRCDVKTQLVALKHG